MTKHPELESQIIAFDFDGVIARYHGFDPKDHPQPNPEVVQAIQVLKAQSFKILVYSTRSDAFLKEYCETHSIPFDYINRRQDKEGENPGKPIAFVYVDDRAVCYHGQSAQELVSEIEKFKSYWEPSI